MIHLEMELSLLKKEKEVLIQRLSKSEAQNLTNANIFQKALQVQSNSQNQAISQQTKEKLLFKEVLRFESDYLFTDFLLKDSYSNFVDKIKQKIEETVKRKFNINIKLVYHNLRMETNLFIEINIFFSLR